MALTFKKPYVNANTRNRVVIVLTTGSLAPCKGIVHPTERIVQGSCASVALQMPPCEGNEHPIKGIVQGRHIESHLTICSYSRSSC